MIFLIDTKKKCNESKNKQVGLRQTKKLLHSEGNHQHNENTIYQMEENICKSYIWSRINTQNIQKTHKTQQQRTKQPNLHFSTEDIQMAQQ